MSIESYGAPRGHASGRQAYADALQSCGLYEESDNLRQIGWRDDVPPAPEGRTAHTPEPPTDSPPRYSRHDAPVLSPAYREERIAFATPPPETKPTQNHLGSAHFGSRRSLQPGVPAQQPPNPINVAQRFLQAAHELTVQPPLDSMYWLQDTAVHGQRAPHTPEAIAASTRAVAIGAHAIAAQVAERPYSSAPDITERFLARVYYEVAPLDQAAQKGEKVSNEAYTAATNLVSQARKEAADAYELLKREPEAAHPVAQAQASGQAVSDISRSAPSRRARLWGRLRFGKRAAHDTGEHCVAA